MRIKSTLYLLAIIVLSTNVLQAQTSDSGVAKPIGLRLLVSANPILQKLSNEEPSAVFYSKSLYELQYAFKKHCIGVGYMRTDPVTNKYVNGVKITRDILTQTFNTSYTYQLHKSKRFDIYAGLGYCYNQIDTLNITYTSIENQTERGLRTMQEFSLLCRVTYNFNPFIGASIEFPFTYIDYNYDYNKQFPLTPSLNSQRELAFGFSRFIVPSNICLRISI